MHYAYPPRVSPEGRLETEELYIEQVADAILSAVQTYKQERVFRPYYGLDTQPFDTAYLPDVIAEVKQAIANGLVGYIGVTYSVLASFLDDGLLEINVIYQVGVEEGSLTIVY